MSTTYNLAPIPVWLFRDKNGEPATDGYLGTFRNTARNEYKAIYQDSAGLIPFPVDIIGYTRLDGTGGINKPIYWSSYENYYVVVRDNNFEIITTIEDYNAPQDGGGPPVPAPVDVKNFVRNGQFLLNHGTLTDADNLGTYHTIAPSWYWQADTNLQGSIAFNEFILGQTDVESNPKYYFEYNCTDVGGGGETKKETDQVISGDVNLFSGEEITLSFAAASAISSHLTIELFQDFGDTGSGASAVVFTLIFDDDLTTNWTKYYATITVPSISGKTIVETSGQQAKLGIRIKYPLNLLSNIKHTNIQVEKGNVVSQYEDMSWEDERSRNSAFLLPQPAPNPDNDDKGKWLKVANDYVVNHDFRTDPLLEWTNLPEASETVAGIAEIATQAETDAGTDDERIVTPLKLKANISPLAVKAWGRIASSGSIDDAENISSVVYEPATTSYKVNFTNHFANAHYAVQLTTHQSNYYRWSSVLETHTSYCRVRFWEGVGSVVQVAFSITCCGDT